MPVVERYARLEQMTLSGVMDAVKKWNGQEGLVIKFSDGSIVKVKSNWWVQSRVDTTMRERLQAWKLREGKQLDRMEQRMHTRRQRLALTRMKGQVKASTI